MAEHELSIIVKAKGAIQAARDIGKVDTAAGRLGRTASRGIRTAAGNAAIIGTGIAVGIGVGVHRGIESLAELEDATTSVQGSINQLGLQGQLSASQVAIWANDIERDIGAAFDDKAIVAATSNLIRFGKVTPSNLRPAMEVMTDLATKTGSVESASSLLGKALADPTKAAGRLARSGVILTKQQQEQIKAFVKAGEVGKAQKVVLDALEQSTRGAAAASQGPYRRSLSVLADVTEDAQRALGEGFLPVIEKVSDLLGSELAKPSTLANIREFGRGLAGGLDDLVDIAKSLPWAVIGDSLKIAAAGAKTVLGAFASLPPWVQTAVLTGWGLNKLTGGALGGIVGEVGKGLVKGVLGMSAGVVNIKAGVVQGVGGGVPGAGGKTGGIAGAASKALSVGAIVAGVAGVIATQQEVSGNSSAIATGIREGLNTSIAGKSLPELRTALAATNTGIERIQSNPLHMLVQGDALNQLQGMRTDLQTQIARVDRSDDAAQRAKEETVRATGRTTQKVDETKAATRAGLAETRRETTRGAAQTSLASRTAGQVGASATRQGSSTIVSAIRSNRPIITVNVSATSVTRTITQVNRSGGGSNDRDHDREHK